MSCSTVQSSEYEWSNLPPLPDAEGFAGMYAGVSHGTLLAAGGANFPDKKPWEGGTKVWTGAIFALERTATAWRRVGDLSRPCGYGVSVSFRDAVICAGGCDAKGHYTDVFRLEFADGVLKTDPLPSLPEPLANSCGAVLGTTLYIAGGTVAPDSTAASKAFLSLDLAAPETGWRRLETWPGAPRMLATASAQSGAFHLFSGAALQAGADGKPVRTYLSDAYAYKPGRGWVRLRDMPHPLVASPTPAPALGQSHILLLGGDDGSKVGFKPVQDHPGFSRGMLRYHTITDTWVEDGAMPAAQVTAPVVAQNGLVAVVSGEVRPGVRSPAVPAFRRVVVKPPFGWVNYLTLLLYPVVMLGISLWVGGKASTDEYFRGGQRIPWWAAGMSIFATVLSSITYMAIPAKAYATDWSFALANLSILFIAPVVIWVFLPFFRQLDVTTAYEYLEKRFNPLARWFGSLSFILFQFGRTAIVIYLPALALATVSEFPIEWCLVMMGAISLAMTFTGGIESVVWTDVAQSALLMLGAIVAIAVVAFALPGGFGEVWSVARSDGKLFEEMSWSSDATVATVWVIVGGNLLSILIQYVGSQDVVQRYQSTRTQGEAARAIWTNAAMTIPATVLFFGVGTALYAFYKLHPERLDPTLPTDAIFPLFMVREMPAGLGGLAVAGVFAAAQPTSSLNSIATAWVTDFYGKFRPAATDAMKLRNARLVTLLSCVGGTIAALAMTRFDIQSLWDTFLTLLGLTGGALAGIFCLGIVSTRANGRGAIVGVICSVTALWFVKQYTSLHFFLFGGLGILTCVAAGWLASFVLREPKRDLAGLTLHTRK